MNLQANVNKALGIAAAARAAAARRKKEPDMSTAAVSSAGRASNNGAERPNSELSTFPNRKALEESKRRVKELGEIAVNQNAELKSMLNKIRTQKGAPTANRILAALGQKQKIKGALDNGKNKQS